MPSPRTMPSGESFKRSGNEIQQVLDSRPPISTFAARSGANARCVDPSPDSNHARAALRIRRHGQRLPGRLRQVHGGTRVGNGSVLTRAGGWDWAAWDIERQTGVQVECQAVGGKAGLGLGPNGGSSGPPSHHGVRYRAAHGVLAQRRWRVGSFSATHSRPAHFYMFTGHGERRRQLDDEGDPSRPQFFVVPESGLPRSQLTIRIRSVESSAARCSTGELLGAAAAVYPIQVEIDG